MALWGPVPDSFSVYGSHNVDQRVIAAEAEAASGLRHLFARVDARKVAREEIEVWRRMPLCLAVSDLDARTMRDAGARRVEVVPNGTDAVEPLPMRYREDDEPLRILFIGSGSYRPNERGIEWFVDAVLPELRSRLPVRFEVVGKPPQQPLSDPDVTYVGTVPSVRPHYERAHVTVVPLFQGSGTRLKVVETLALGRPLVSTPIGAEGLGLVPGRHFLEGRDAAGFVRALEEVAEDLSRRSGRTDAIVAAGMEAVATLTWERIGARLADLYLAEARAATAESSR